MGAQLPIFSRYVLVDQSLIQSGFLSGLSSAAKTAARSARKGLLLCGKVS